MKIINDRIYPELPQDKVTTEPPAKGEGIQTHNYIVGKILSWFTKKVKLVTVNDKEVYANIDSLAKFALRKDENEAYGGGMGAIYEHQKTNDDYKKPEAMRELKEKIYNSRDKEDVNALISSMQNLIKTKNLSSD